MICQPDLFLMSSRVLAMFLRCWNAWDGTHQKIVDFSFKPACFIRSTWVMWPLPFRLESTDQLITSYRKIQRISPGAYIFQRPFLRGLYSEGLIYGMKFGFQNRLGQPYRRVLMGVPSSQLTTIFSAKNQLTTIFFLVYSLFTTNLCYLSTFTFLQRILFCHNPYFFYFSTSINFGVGPTKKFKLI